MKLCSTASWPLLTDTYGPLVLIPLLVLYIVAVMWFVSWCNCR